MIRELIPKVWKGAVVTLNNCPIHFSSEIEKSIEDQGAKLIYLLPYYRDFTPIENFWSQVKLILRKLRPRTYRELDQFFKEAFNQVSTKDLITGLLIGVVIPHLSEKRCKYCNHFTPFEL